MDYSVLRDCVDRNDYIAFLRLYLDQIQKGEELPLPTDITYDVLKAHWIDIVVAASPTYTELFIEHLMGYWLLLLRCIPDPSPDTLVSKCYQLLVSGFDPEDIPFPESEYVASINEVLKRLPRLSQDRSLYVGISDQYQGHLKYHRDSEGADDIQSRCLSAI